MFAIRMDMDDRVTALLNAFPQFAKRAEASALKSAGHELYWKMRRFIESGGAGWTAIGPFTQATRKSEGGPLHFLGRFIRYSFSRRGGTAQVVMGVLSTPAARRAKLREAAAARGLKQEVLTPLLMFRKAEEGKSYRVTGRMRRAMAALGMPIRKGTKKLEVPRRPIFEPVWRREEERISSFLLERYLNAMLRYATEGRLGKKQ